jgi:THO complex subunit 6
VSASEDGTARIWDLRQQQEAQVIKPHLESKLARPALGKWLAAAAINNDWMVCTRKSSY